MPIGRSIKHRRYSISSSLYLFRSSFEKKKTIEYFRNLVDSPFVNYKPIEMLKFSEGIVGQKRVLAWLNKEGFIKDRRKMEYDNKSFDDIDEDYQWLTRKNAVKCLKHFVLPLLEDKLTKIRDFNDSLGRRLYDIQSTFKLSDEETNILFFYYLLSASSVFDNDLIESFSSSDSRVINFKSLLGFKNYGHFFFGISRAYLDKILSDGPLLRLELLEIDYRSVESSFMLTGWCQTYLSSVNKKNLEHKFFSTLNDSDLGITNFSLTSKEADILKDILTGKNKCNVLFYGAPGTGKTALAKTLAKQYKKDLLTVKIPDAPIYENDDGTKIWMQAITATINLANRNSIILIDEADDLLNTASIFYERRTRKSWINNFLDSHQRKIIWITNNTHAIETSTMRRFSFSIEFKELKNRDRLRVLRYELKKHRMGRLLLGRDLIDLCGNYNVDAAGIINALSLCRSSRIRNKEALLGRLRIVLKNHEKAVSAYKKKEIKQDVVNYSLQGLHTSHNLAEVVTSATHFLASAQKGCSFSILLYGIPGTGKTEFVRYLGHVLERDVVLKRGSDIMSTWVGQTEKNIANAFHEAEEENLILFFDEADSFLFPRSSAQRSWEITFTNEILAQLDSFKGMVVFSTNDIDGIDHAALRRFKFKIEFRPLTPEGNLHFYDIMLRPLVKQKVDLSAKQIIELKSIKDLTAGDFAVVKEQFVFLNQQDITHKRLIEALAAEMSHKKGIKKIVGFEGR